MQYIVKENLKKCGKVRDGKEHRTNAIMESHSDFCPLLASLITHSKENGIPLHHLISLASRIIS